MKKFLASAAVLALLTGGAFAGNMSDIDQWGDLNAAAHVQAGNLNTALTTQISPVGGPGNLDIAFQTGVANTSSTLQVGGNNQSLSDQFGALNTSNTTQVGFNGHVAVHTQTGTGNVAISVQTD